MKKYTNITQIKRQLIRGFTLIELVVVVAIIGVLIALVAPNIAGSRDGATATLLSRASQVMASNWNIISQTCGTTTDTVTSPIPNVQGAANIVKLLFGGSNATNNGTAIAPAYATCYSQAKVIPLAEMAQYDGAWKVSGFPVTVAGGGSAPMQIIFTGVPTSIVHLVASKYNAAITLATVTAVGSIPGVLEWTVATGGTSTLTLIRQVS